MINICMLWHNKIVMFFGLHNWVFLLSLYMPMHDMFKKKNMQRKIKAIRIETLLNLVASVFLEDVGVIGCTS